MGWMQWMLRTGGEEKHTQLEGTQLETMRGLLGDEAVEDREDEDEEEGTTAPDTGDTSPSTPASSFSVTTTSTNS